ncbi:hypothetical protein HDU98_001656 [Podochytrium sp. JEL0797]|nr:hypothetical protein HDU98_001656 [Podochytrium sp. JEL0797]
MPRSASKPNFALSITSGLLAASATLFAKLLASFSHELRLPFLPSWLQINPKFVLLPLVIASNVAMWAVFTRALNSSPSSAAVSVLNSSANMIASAILGYFLFDEHLSVRWWIGAAFVLAGTALMNSGFSELTARTESSPATNTRLRPKKE